MAVASSDRVPVLFVPGGSASHPTVGKILDFVFNRGFPPEELRISPSYYTTIETLKKVGYEEGKSLFGAAYDYRMRIAPLDGNNDGTLSKVTAELMTSGDYSYCVNYLGYWLDQAVQANPELKEVDVVTHSTGGVVIRAYIQSPAYGAEYIRDGKTRRLPRVRKLILGASTDEGTVHSWRPWHGDFQDVLGGFIPTTEFEGRLVAFAYTQVELGASIPGPDYTITQDDYLRVDKFGRLSPDPTIFFRLYFPLRQDLMPTYNFIIRDDQLTNVNDNPEVRSNILLDLNALSTSGHNPWLARVGKAYATYATGARQTTSFLDFLVPGQVNNNPYEETLSYVEQLPKPEGQYLPLLELLHQEPQVVNITLSLFPRVGDVEISEPLNGDGNVPFESLLTTFAGDPSITLVQWGNGPVPDDLPLQKRWKYFTDYPVYHVAFFFNPDVAAFVASTLSGKEVAPQSPPPESLSFLYDELDELLTELFHLF